MNMFTKIVGVGMELLLCCAMSAADKPEAGLPVQQANSVRVILLTVTTNNVLGGEAKLPGTSLVYFAEALDKKPKELWTVQHMDFFVGGKKIVIPKKSWDDARVVLSDYKKYDWKTFQKPAVSKPEDTLVYSAWIPEFRLPKGKLEVRIYVGLTGPTAKVHTFAFKDVAIE